MSNFAPGDEVVCVREEWTGPHCSGETDPTVNNHYTVRDVITGYPDGIDGLRFHEIRNPPSWDGLECTFQADHFRPVKRSSVAIFRAMCTSKKPLVPVEG